MVLVLSTHGSSSSDHYIEQCILCCWERASSLSCTITFETFILFRWYSMGSRKVHQEMTATVHSHEQPFANPA